jgi:site-specific DNA recombinase
LEAGLQTKREGAYGKGALTYLLKNRAYVGEIAHRGEIHPAEHEVILERSLFDAVQAKIQQNSVTRKLKLRSAPHLLTGLLFDSAGNRMSPSHTVK